MNTTIVTLCVEWVPGLSSWLSASETSWGAMTDLASEYVLHLNRKWSAISRAIPQSQMGESLPVLKLILQHCITKKHSVVRNAIITIIRKVPTLDTNWRVLKPALSHSHFLCQELYVISADICKALFIDIHDFAESFENVLRHILG